MWLHIHNRHIHYSLKLWTWKLLFKWAECKPVYSAFMLGVQLICMLNRGSQNIWMHASNRLRPGAKRFLVTTPCAVTILQKAKQWEKRFMGQSDCPSSANAKKSAGQNYKNKTILCTLQTSFLWRLLSCSGKISLKQKFFHNFIKTTQNRIFSYFVIMRDFIKITTEAQMWLYCLSGACIFCMHLCSLQIGMFFVLKCLTSILCHIVWQWKFSTYRGLNSQIPVNQSEKTMWKASPFRRNFFAATQNVAQEFCRQQSIIFHAGHTWSVLLVWLLMLGIENGSLFSWELLFGFWIVVSDPAHWSHNCSTQLQLLYTHYILCSRTESLGK